MVEVLPVPGCTTHSLWRCHRRLPAPAPPGPETVMVRPVREGREGRPQLFLGTLTKLTQQTLPNQRTDAHSNPSCARRVSSG